MKSEPYELTAFTTNPKESPYVRNREFFNKTVVPVDVVNRFYRMLFLEEGKKVYDYMYMDDRRPFWRIITLAAEQLSLVDKDYFAYIWANFYAENCILMVWNMVYDRTEGDSKTKYKEADRVKTELIKMLKEFFP